MIQYISSWLRPLLKYHFFMACCAVVLSINSSYFMQIPFRTIYFYAFIFGCTFSAYNAYYIQDNNKKYALQFSILGAIITLLSLTGLRQISFGILSILTLLAFLYLFPIFTYLKKNKYILLLRLLVLVATWTLTTTLLPLTSFSNSQLLISIVTYRFLLLWNLCLLFLIRDEAKYFTAFEIKWILIVSLALQLLTSLSTIITNHKEGVIFSLVSFATICVSCQTQKQKKDNYYYLFIVDGIMLLEGILLFLLTKLSGL